MGIWSIEGFASDDALDWVQGLDPAAGVAPVVRVLRHLVQSSDPRPDAHAALVALAAAELVAALHGHPHPDLPEAARCWLDAQAAPQAGGGGDLEALTLATRALDSVVTGSTLSDIFSQRVEEPLWRAELDDLRMRLAAAGRAAPARPGA